MVDESGAGSVPIVDPSPRKRVKGSELRRLLEGRWQGLLGVTALSLVGGMAQAALLVLVVKAGSALVARDGVVSLGFGPLPDVELHATAVFVWLVCLAACVLATEVLTAVIASQLAATTLEEMRNALYEAYSAAPWAVQDQERSGHLQEHIMTNTSNAAQAALIAASGLSSLVGVTTLLLAALVVDIQGALAISAVLGLLALALRPLRERSRRHSETIVATNLELVSVLSQGVELAQEIAAYGVGAEVRSTFMEADQRVVGAFFRRYRLQRMLPAVFRNSALLLVLLAMAALYAAQASNFATLSAVVLVLVRAVTYAQGSQVAGQQLTELLPWASRVWDSLERYRAAEQPAGTATLEPVRTVQLSRVSYSYVPGRAALRDVNISLRRGEAVGIIGPSGAGKSTLVQLLLGLRQPDTGAVLVNDQDVRDIRRADFCCRVAFVPQDTRTLAASAAENIRFFREGLSREEIEHAAVAAHLEEDIRTWPLGFDTLMHERGGGLSGGQRQRLALARALVGRPDVLVLDEPTSALDASSESLVNETLRSLKGHVLLVIVAHRLSTLRLCDRLIVMEDGFVTADGPADELQLSSDFYREALRLSQA